MKKTRWLIAASAATMLAVIVSFIGCQTGPSSKRLRVVAIVTLQTHPILDAVQNGIIGELKRQNYQDGRTIRLVVRNANGDMQRVASIAAEISALNPDVTVAISTPIAQAVVKASKGPVVFGALTDPVGAGVVASLDKPTSLVTGTTDALPYEEQLRLIRKIRPTSNRLGLLFNPGEAASQFALKELRRTAPTMGFELVEGAVNSTNEVYPVALDLASRVDALLISTDNTVAAGIAGAVKVAVEKKIPLFACDSGSVEKGAIAAVSAGYADIGIETGKLVSRILSGERNIPIVAPKGGEVYLNMKTAELMGVVIPESILTQATRKYDEVK